MKVEKTIHVYASEKEIEIIGNFCALLEEMDEETWKNLDDAMLGDLSLLAEKANDLYELIEPD